MEEHTIMPQENEEMDASSVSGPMQQFNEKVHDHDVTVTVGRGSDSKQFKIPKSLLCSRAKWFAYPLEHNGFKESSTNTINLPDDGVTAFEAFHYFIYREDLTFPEIDSIESTKLPDEIEYCIDIWLFGDKYDVPGLQNCSMLRMCRVLRHDNAVEIKIPLDTLARCFSETMAESPLRKLAADYVVESVEQYGRNINDFASLASLDGFQVETYLSLKYCTTRVWQDSFPRYFQVIQHKELFKVDDKNDADGKRDGGNYTRWDHSRHSCDKCGTSPAYGRCEECERPLQCECDQWGNEPRGTQMICRGCA